MKSILCLLTLAWLLDSTARAEFRTWTRADGKTAELELVATSGDEGDKSAEFKTKKGSSITLKASQLAPDDAARVNAWKPETNTTPPAVAKSALDDVLDGNLLQLTDGRLKSLKDHKKPTKYYALYYSASWCGPCHRFTPHLVEFYNRLKPKHDEFEIVLISSDRDAKSMEDYVEEMEMPWPALEYRKVEKFRSKHPYPGSGIPNLVLVDLSGKLIKGSYRGQTYEGPQVVMKELERLLTEESN